MEKRKKTWKANRIFPRTKSTKGINGIQNNSTVYFIFVASTFLVNMIQSFYNIIQSPTFISTIPNNHYYNNTTLHHITIFNCNIQFDLIINSSYLATKSKSQVKPLGHIHTYIHIYIHIYIYIYFILFENFNFILSMSYEITL